MEAGMPQQRELSSASPASRRSEELERLRASIDAVDDAIVERLNERARLAQEIGRWKEREHAPVYAAGRERDIVARLAASNPGPFPNAALAPVFREIISGTRALERPLRIAYLGPAGTFCHLAARENFGVQGDFQPVRSIAEIVAAVERGAADLGVLPVENTTEGVVTQTLDALVEAEATICAELVLRISLSLLSRSGRLEDVRRVVSHPQPFAQCRGWLERELPGVERMETASTAAAAQLAAGDPTLAAIASPIAAETYGLQTVAAGIEDRRDNTTRFLVIGRGMPEPTGNDLTSAVFTLRRDECGALHRLLEAFAGCSVNLASIQSRPMKGRPWEYLFFIDMEGHARDEPVARALAEAGRRASSHRVLGAFPRAGGTR
jgi:chorismate mutase/prephenate dehydratase